MRTTTKVGTLILIVLLAACAARPSPVPLMGDEGDLAALVGRWAGEYSSSESGRSGSITFTLAARGDTAYGDVVMVPAGWGRPLEPARREPGVAAERPVPEVLTIRFVRVSGGRVSGALAPYRDPECGCTLLTTFDGRLQGDTIDGTYQSRHERMEELTRGRWKVTREPAR